MKPTTLLHEIRKAYRLPPTIKQLLARPTYHLTQEGTQDALPHNVTVNGWIKSIRKQKRVSFATVSDGSTATGLQAVLQTSIVPKESVFSFSHSLILLTKL
jgi:asparaginyl-tRNA synthetase